VDRVEPLDGLDLNKHTLIDEQVDSKRGVEPQAFENDVHWSLAFNPVTDLRELACKDGLVDGLEEARAEVAMNPDRDIQYVAADLVDGLQTASLSASLREPVSYQSPAMVSAGPDEGAASPASRWR